MGNCVALHRPAWRVCGILPLSLAARLDRKRQKESEALEKTIADLNTELRAAEEQACIAVRVKDCHIHPRLVGGLSKAMREGTIDDPSLAVDFFVSVRLVSSFLHRRGLHGYSLQVSTKDGKTESAKWLPNSLGTYHKDNDEPILDTFGNVESESRREALYELERKSLQYTIPEEGWLHFLMEGIRMSDAQNAPLTVTLKDSMGLCYEGRYEAARSNHGDIWPNKI